MRTPRLLLIIVMTVLLVLIYRTEPLVIFDEPNIPLSADVVIVGNGVSGLSATLGALEKGAEVILIEHEDFKEEFPGKAGSGLVGIPLDINQETEDEGENEENYFPEIYFEKISKASPHINQYFLNLLLEKSSGIDEWLYNDIGLEIYYEQDRFPGLFMLPDNNNLVAILESRIERKIKINLARRFTDFKVAEILLNQENGKIIGLIINDDEKEIEIRAPAVVMATGGYAANSLLLAEAGFNGDAYHSFTRKSGVKGEEIVLVRNIGAKTINLDNLKTALYISTKGKELDLNELNFYAENYIINALGTELSEDIRGLLLQNQTNISQFIAAQPESYLDIIVTQSSLNQFPHFENILIEIKSIEELSRESGIEQSILQDLLELYSAPYYYARIISQVLYTMGGLEVNEDMEVIFSNENFSGIFAAGEITGGFYGADFYPGLPLTEALIFGRLAGQNAANLARK